MVTTTPGSRTGERQAELDVVGPGYFEALGIRPLAGRTFRAEDFTGGDPRTIVVSHSLARSLWGDDPAVGKTLYLRGRLRVDVIGVVPDARFASMALPPAPRFYFSVLDSPNPQFYVYIRTGLPLPQLTNLVTKAVVASNPASEKTVSVTAVRTDVATYMRPFNTTSELGIAFAVVVGLLAAAGIYGGLSVDLAARRTEIGVRMAVGATPSAIVGLVTRRIVTLLAVAVITGTAFSALVLTTLQDSLFEARPMDSRVMLIVSGYVLLLVCVATAVPLYRSVRVNLQSLLTESPRDR
jgi:hypothetical protein